jgi:uncharacterized protein (DUF983 family)
MNPIYQLAALFGMRKGLRRRCPTCGLTVRLSDRQRREVVRCPSCRTAVPPDPEG